MALLNSCCFWNTLRKGSYVSGIYTLIYFGISCLTISLFLYDERRYLSGEIEEPAEMSFIGNTPTTVIFNMLLLLCASFGIFASLFMLVGLSIDCRQLLLPWIFTMIADIIVAASYFLFVIIYEKVEFKVLTAFIFTIDFFVVILNVYCLLCVISQYQENKIGRGMRKESFVNINDVSFLPSTDMVTLPNNGIHSKSSSLMCAHTSCNLPNGSVTGNMNYADEIVPWTEQEFYEPNC